MDFWNSSHNVSNFLLTFSQGSNLNKAYYPLTMNKSLASKSTARRKAFSKRWCLQRKSRQLKGKQHLPDKKSKNNYLLYLNI